MNDISLKKAAMFLAAAVIAVLVIMGISRNNSGGTPSGETAAKTESVQPAANEAEPAASEPAAASVPEDKKDPEAAKETENPEETGTATEDADQSQSASGKENKGNKGNSSGNSSGTPDEGEGAVVSGSESAEAGTVSSEVNGIPVLELDAVKAGAGQAVQTPDTSGDEQQQVDNEASMMTDF